MVSDSINLNASVAPRDFAKKKRANRSARLKQCKLDARREQWLSQGTGKSKEQKMPSRASPSPLSPCKSKERKNLLEKLAVDDDENENGATPLHHHHHDFDTDSPSNSPISNSSSVLGATTDSGTNSTASSSCSGNSAGSCSGNITEEEDEEDDDVEDENCLDDWETMADALAANVDDAKEEGGANDDSHCEHEPRIQVHDRCTSLGSSVNLRPEFQLGVPPRATSCNARAWRPDDAFRPQSLPTLSKQRSFPDPSRPYSQGGALPWSSKSHNMPSSCPICCEDLDPTDSSFSPCTCGFRLCLFCHKRILEEDGRCPSCRKPYQLSKVEAEPSILGGSLTVRLARSCSMRS